MNDHAAAAERSESVKNHDFASFVCIYSQLLPTIREAGKRLGYALAIHGSMQRDLDIVAVPWVEDAAPAEMLVQAVADEVHGYVIGDLDRRGEVLDPVLKPHGRKSWSISWGGSVFVDLSVMPRVSLVADAARIAELEAIVHRLPTTADGKPCVPGDVVWPPRHSWLPPLDGVEQEAGATIKMIGVDNLSGEELEVDADLRIEVCYSSKQAAAAAAESEGQR